MLSAFDDSPSHPYAVAAADEGELFVASVVDHKGTEISTLESNVRWAGHDSSDDSWLPLKKCNDLEALDVYLRMANMPKRLGKRLREGGVV